MMLMNSLLYESDMSCLTEISVDYYVTFYVTCYITL